ncbi:MAG: tape measure protein, partial [Clostridiales bacterium]
MQVVNTLSLNDKTTPVLRQVVKTIGATIASMQKLDDTGDFSKTREQLTLLHAMLGETDNELKQVNKSQDMVKKGFVGWKASLAGVAGGIYTLKSAMMGISSLTGIIDANTSMNARLDLVRDDNTSKEQMKGITYATAQNARGNYGDIGSVIAKLDLLAGDSFKNDAEVAGFTGLMQKSFRISGASTQEQTAGMYQLTQAMAAGKLQGDEFRSIMENAPMLAQAIAEYTGKSKGEL